MSEPSARKFGYELEYASGVNSMLPELHDRGMLGMARPHDYHCSCQDCAYVPTNVEVQADDGSGWMMQLIEPRDLRCQRDSTADGEFITRPLDDWAEMQSITADLTEVARDRGATTSARCGLHVHVDSQPGDDDAERQRKIIPAIYLAFERYFTEIVAPGASVRKRDMNSTLMESARNYVADAYGRHNNTAWMDMSRAQIEDLLLAAIGRDRHVDLNWSRRNSTWEFRVFNATNAAWRIELACRMSVAFIEAAPQLRSLVESTVRGSKLWPEGCDSPWGEIVRPAFSNLTAPQPTKKPVVPMEQFVDILCDVDENLRPLIERQANFMRARYAKMVEVAV